MCSRSVRSLAATGSIEDTLPPRYCTESFTAPKRVFVGGRKLGKRRSMTCLRDGGLRDGFLIPDNVGINLKERKLCCFGGLQTCSDELELEAMMEAWRWRRTARRVLCLT